jgi:hypothetical protein
MDAKAGHVHRCAIRHLGDVIYRLLYYKHQGNQAGDATCRRLAEPTASTQAEYANLPSRKIQHKLTTISNGGNARDCKMKNA